MNHMYTADGDEVKVFGKLEDGSYVGCRVIYTHSEDEEPYHTEGAIDIWQKLFTEPPSYKTHPTVVAREKYLVDLNEQVEVAKKALKTAKEGMKAFEKLPNVDQLKMLLDIANGVPMWLVNEKYGNIEIREYPKDYLGQYGSTDDMPALSYMLAMGKYHNPHGMRLIIHRYYDGSGDVSSDIKLFRTKEEALEYAKPQLIKKAKEVDGNNAYAITHIEKLLTHWGLEFPAELVAARKKSDAIQLAQYERELAKAQQEIDKIKGMKQEPTNG